MSRTPLAVTALKIWPDSVLYLSAGEKVTFVVRGVFTDGVERDITKSQCGTSYQITIPSVATIDTNGVLTAKASGFCMVTVRNGVSVQIPVLVEGSGPAADTNSPKVAITSPTPGQRWSNAVFTVRGTASDNVQVNAVSYQLNGGAWASASSTNHWTNWNATVTLPPGTNVVRAYAMERGGQPVAD